MPENDKSQYKSVFKATALFGGVQVWQILINVVRSKLVAMILGPAGMGITGLLTSSTELVRSCTNLGLGSSGVKYIAEAKGTEEKSNLFRVASVFNRLMWITGLLGMIGVIVFSPLLSKSAFGDTSYTLAFIVLSITLLIQQLSSGKLAILQGTRQLTSLAKTSLIGSILSLLLTVPLYYLWGNNGIVPALIVGSAISLLLNWWYSQKLRIEDIKLSIKEVVKEGRGMVVMGLAMTLSGILSTAVAYLIRVFVSNKGGTADVGQYTAGMTIMTTYVGMIFAAMSTDYFPRLSSYCKDNKKCTQLINQQSEISLLILGPVLVLFLIFAPLAVRILYSNEFLPTVGYMQWACIGMLFKAVSWAISFLFLAKGDSKVFINNEAIANLITICASIVGYSFWGLDGLGIAFLCSYILYLVIVLIVCMRKYGFELSSPLLKIFMLQLLALAIVFFTVRLVSGWVEYSVLSVISLLCVVFSLYELDKRVDLREFVCKILCKR